MLDVAVSYNRYKFIGHEFLTWLWFSIENKNPLLKTILPLPGSIQIGNRIKIENHQRQHPETITIKGDEAGLEEGILALKKGALVTELNLIVETDTIDRQFTIRGESLNIGGLKVEIKGPFEKKEEVDEQILDKAYHYDEIIRVVDSLYHEFIKIRVSPAWEDKTVSLIKNWIFS